MKSSILVLGLAIIATALFATGTKMPKEEKVRHIVVFDYEEGASEEEIRNVTEAFRSLQDEIPGIVSFEHGVNNSPEGLNQDYTHVYMVTFEDAAARDAYLPHPAHQEFGQLLEESGIFEGAFVVDYAPSE